MHLKQHSNKLMKTSKILLHSSSNFRNNIEFAVGANRLIKGLLFNINFKCPILAQVATYLLEDPEELRGFKPFLELSFCSFLLLLFFGEVRPHRENRQNPLGNRSGT